MMNDGHFVAGAAQSWEIPANEVLRRLHHLLPDYDKPRCSVIGYW